MRIPSHRDYLSYLRWATRRGHVCTAIIKPAQVLCYRSTVTGKPLWYRLPPWMSSSSQWGSYLTEVVSYQQVTSRHTVRRTLPGSQWSNDKTCCGQHPGNPSLLYGVQGAVGQVHGPLKEMWHMLFTEVWSEWVLTAWGCSGILDKPSLCWEPQ